MMKMFPYNCPLTKQNSEEMNFNQEICSIHTDDNSSHHFERSKKVPNLTPRCHSQDHQIQFIVWRVAAGLMGFFFLICTVLQFNDVDPYIWIPAYIIPCVVSWAVSGTGQKRDMQKRIKVVPIFTFKNNRLDWIINIHILYCFIIGLYTLSVHIYRLRYYYGHQFYPGILHDKILCESIGMDSSEEEALELFGLVIVVTWMTLVKFYVL